MAPCWRSRGVLKECAVPIERLAQARFPEALPFRCAFLECRLHFESRRVQSPGEHDKTVDELDMSQTRIACRTDRLSHWATISLFRCTTTERTQTSGHFPTL